MNANFERQIQMHDLQTVLETQQGHVSQSPHKCNSYTEYFFKVFQQVSEMSKFRYYKEPKQFWIAVTKDKSAVL